MATTVFRTDFPDLKLVGRGKVRDIYDMGDTLLIVTTDRLSAFDVILPTPIPGKGEVLNQMSLFWFGKTSDIVENHVLSADPADYPAEAKKYADILRGRSMLVKKAKTIPVVCRVSLREGQTTRLASSHDSRAKTTKSRPACVNHITPAAQANAPTRTASRMMVGLSAGRA